MPDKLTTSDLAQFTGSETFYRHNLMRNVVYTEGVQFLADKGGAYWLIDKIATLQMDPKVRAEAFQAWKLEVVDGKARLTCDDGNGVFVYAEHIDYTDFPLSEITLWAVQGEHRTIMLPSEY